jgi:hypothetical protein
MTAARRPRAAPKPKPVKKEGTVPRGRSGSARLPKSPDGGGGGGGGGGAARAGKEKVKTAEQQAALLESRIAALKALREKELISESEFEVAKAKCLTYFAEGTLT